MIPHSPRLRGLSEVVLFGALLLATLWGLGPNIQGNRMLLPVYWLLVSAGAALILWLSPFVLHRDPAAIRGWALRSEQPRMDRGSISNAWPYYAGFTLVAGTLIILVGLWRNPAIFSLIPPMTFVIRLLGYSAFGPIQALIFFGFLHTRWREIITQSGLAAQPGMHQSLVALATAGCFSAVHYPNLPLMAFTLLAGLCWSRLFYWRPNILLLGLSHAMLGTLLHLFLRISMRIGPFYDAPGRYILRSVVPGLSQLIGHRF